MGIPRMRIIGDALTIEGVLEVTPTTTTRDTDLIFRNLRLLVELLTRDGQIVLISVKVE